MVMGRKAGTKWPKGQGARRRRGMKEEESQKGSPVVWLAHEVAGCCCYHVLEDSRERNR